MTQKGKLSSVTAKPHIFILAIRLISVCPHSPQLQLNT